MRTLETSGQFTGRHMAFILGGFFATVFAANASLVVAARESWSGLVVENSYVASQNFNETTAQLQASKAFGLHAVTEFDGQTISVRVRNQAAQPVELENPVLEIGDAKNEDAARHVLTRQTDGTWTTPAKLSPGRWTGVITATVPGKGSWVQVVSLQAKP